MVSFSHLLKWLLQHQSKLLEWTPQSSRVTPFSFTFSYETELPMTTLVEFQKLFPVFLARAGKGFQIFNFDSGRSNSQQNLKFQDVLYQGHARFFCKDPPNLHLDASSYPKPDFNICVGSDKAELFSQTFFFIMPGESHLSARSPSTNQNFSTVTKRDSCRVCALPIGAEVMVKSEAPPHKLCQP